MQINIWFNVEDGEGDAYDLDNYRYPFWASEYNKIS